MVQIDFSCPKTWGQTLKSSLQHALNPSYNFGQFRPGQNCPKWPFWPLRSIWCVWKWSQSISHAQKPGDRHQNQVPNMFRTQVTIQAILSHFNGQNGHFGHSGQSEVTENGPNRFPMPKNLGIDTKIKSVACSEPKLQFWPIQTWPKFPKWPFWPLRSI